MKVYNKSVDLIITAPNSDIAVQGKSLPEDITGKLSSAGIGINTEVQVQAKAIPGKGGALKSGNTLVKTTVDDTEINPWDVAHLAADALGKNATYVEPDLYNQFIADKKIISPAGELTAKSFGMGKPRSEDDFDTDWLPGQNTVWHLEKEYSQLKPAREAVSAIDYKIRIGQIDTGYSSTHFIIPDSVKNNPLQRNFVDEETYNDAHDPYSKGLLKNPGHGTGVYGILAGDKITIDTATGKFEDYLGGAYFAEVISCRISKSVVLLKTNAFAEALNYLTQLSLSGKQVHVVSMSMGGAPSKVWADAVNAAYKAGITVVTASGNNFGGLPTRHVIYPARFKRVIAACGVTYEKKPYWHKKATEMQGCYGPPKHMTKALSAFTPNTPWASVESGNISFSGAGTSSATPQIAAAAAIYYKKNHAELDALEPWQRVEAIRYALFKSAEKEVGDPQYDNDFTNYFGNGILKAHDALNIPVNKNLPMTPEDSVPWFPILNTLFKSVPDEAKKAKRDMFNTEIAQLVYYYPELFAIIDNGDGDYVPKEDAKWETFKNAVINHPDASVTLTKYLQEAEL